MQYKSGLSLVLFVLFLSPDSYCQTPLSLKEAIQAARTNNLDLKTAHYNIGMAESDVTSANLRPNLALNNQTLQSVNSKYHPAGSEYLSPVNRQVWWQLTKPIRLPQQKRYRVEVAQQGVILEQNNYLELQRNLAYDVANQWLETWLLKTKLDLYLQAQHNIDSLVKISEFRLKNLVITRTDYIRTKLIAEQYNLQIRNVSQSYLNEVERLQYLIGKNDAIAIAADDTTEPLMLDKSLDTLIASGYSNRTDVLAAKSAIQVTESNIRFQRSLAYPVPELGMIWNPQNNVPYLGFFGTIQVPLFSRNQGEIAKSQLAQQQARQGLESLQLKIRTEVETAFRSYTTQKENLQKYENILEESEAVLNSVRYAYLKGGTTIIDFLEAQRTWFDTRQLYYDAVVSYRKSYFELLYTTGLINQLYE